MGALLAGVIDPGNSAPKLSLLSIFDSVFLSDFSAVFFVLVISTGFELCAVPVVPVVGVAWDSTVGETSDFVKAGRTTTAGNG
jgi:hypothetical protein